MKRRKMLKSDWELSRCCWLERRSRGPGLPKDCVTSFRMVRRAEATEVEHYQCLRARSAVTHHSNGLLSPDRPPGGSFSEYPHSCGELLHAIHPQAVFLRPCPERSKLPIDGRHQPI